jgi:hypothetical protein
MLVGVVCWAQWTGWVVWLEWAVGSPRNALRTLINHFFFFQFIVEN